MRLQGQNLNQGKNQDTKSNQNPLSSYGIILNKSQNLGNKIFSVGKGNQNLINANKESELYYKSQRTLKTQASAGQGTVDNKTILTQEEIKRRLDYVPKLKTLEFYLILFVSGLLASVVYALNKQANQILRFLLTFVSFFAPFRIIRRFFLQNKVKALEVEYYELAGESSRFINVDGIIHHYIQRLPNIQQNQQRDNPYESYNQAQRLHFFHGFGSNSCSYAYVMQPLADQLQSVVTASDTLGFGLTQRVDDIEKYNFNFDSLVGYAIANQNPSQSIRNIDQVRNNPIPAETLQELQTSHDHSRDFTADTQSGQVRYPHVSGAGSKSDQKSAKNIVVFGHSMGANPAIKMAINHPDRVKALILIAPASYQVFDSKASVQARLIEASTLIGTTRISRYISEHNVSQGDDKQIQDEKQKIQQKQTLKEKIFKSPLIQFVRRKLLQLQVVSQLILKPVYIEFLRGFVSLKKNWVRVFRYAYYDPELLKDSMVYAYMQPRIVKNWETGLFNFSYSKIYQSAKKQRQKTEEKNGGYKPVTWLQEAVDKHNLKILVIHGRQDRIVPLWVGQRLAKSVNATELVEIEGCGHTAHEEQPELFTKIVSNFLERLN